MNTAVKRSVVITGASSGIGLQLAKDYAEEGWEVYACGRNQQKLLQAYDNTNINTLCFDNTDQAACQNALSAIEHIDLAILSAGDCKYIDNAKTFNTNIFQHNININVNGTANCLSPILNRMNNGSHIAIVSSACTFLPLPRAEGYGASKAALDYLTRTLAVDLAQHGINVSLIRPGFVDTPLTEKNNFEMPFLTSLPQASKAIRKGLAKGKREISFPPVFIFILKLLSALPRALQHQLGTIMARPTSKEIH